MRKKTLSALLVFFSSLFAFVLYLYFFQPIFLKAVSETISTSTKIAVCGDGVVEGPEDCEGEDLDGATCGTLGYEPGTLSCDIACSYDTSQCGPKITPTPTPTPTATPTPTSTSTSDSSSDASTTSTSTDQVTETTSQPLRQIVETVFRLPQRIRRLDPTTTSDDHIAPSETEDIVSQWVASWRSFVQVLYQTPTPSGNFSCDLNGDQNCNSQDLSILLYYINK